MIRFLLSIGVLLSRAYVGAILFNWFMVTTFDVPSIGFVSMLGIVLLINLLFKLNGKDFIEAIQFKEGREATKVEQGIVSLSVILLIFILLGMGYLVNLFM